MSVWLARAGKNGENEALAIENNIVTIGWNALGDLSSANVRQDLYDMFESTYPNAGKGRVANHVGQVWAFRARFKVGDLVVLPLKTQSAIAIGKITGDYQYRTDLGDSAKHARPVEWLKTDLPRTTFDQDLLHSFGAFMTVCEIKRNDAEKRIRAIAEGKSAPKAKSDLSDEDTAGDDSPLNVEEAARDQIIQFIQQKFAGHELANLVAEVLNAEGFLTRVSPPGRDGGVDILAGAGPMGFDSPRLCVQVKSGQSPIDVMVLRELQGILQTYQAEQGLLVSWGGFKTSVTKEAKQSFFNIRLWDSGQLLEAVLQNYDKLSDELQAELPLKHCWTLVYDDS